MKGGRGRLRHSVTLQKKSVTRDAMGGEVVTWADQANVYAAIEPLRGQELMAAQQMQAKTGLRVRIDYRADITAEWRVKFGARIFALEAPPLDLMGRGVELHLMCSEGVLDG